MIIESQLNHDESVKFNVEMKELLIDKKEELINEYNEFCIFMN
jgi:hypothetical protein